MAGTGSEGLRSNVSPGKGVWKSIDAGKTWAFAGLPQSGHIGAVRIHPTNPDIVWVAALGNAFAPSSERGVYRTRDGGRSWRKVLFVSDSTGAVDLELQPGNPNVVYASMWRAERKPWTIISGAREGGIDLGHPPGHAGTREDEPCVRPCLHDHSSGPEKGTVILLRVKPARDTKDIRHAWSRRVHGGQIETVRDNDGVCISEAESGVLLPPPL